MKTWMYSSAGLIAAMSLTLAACSDNPPSGVLQTDVTSQALVPLVGNFASPGARLRVRADGTFNLKLAREEIGSYRDGSVTGTTNARCSSVKSGTVQVLERSGTRYLRLNVTRSAMIASDYEGDRQNCQDFEARFENTSIELVLEQQSNVVWLHGYSQTDVPEAQWLQFFNQGDQHLNSYIMGRTALLFTPVDGETDVTAQVAPLFRNVVYGDGGPYKIQIDPEFNQITLSYYNDLVFISNFRIVESAGVISLVTLPDGQIFKSTPDGERLGRRLKESLLTLRQGPHRLLDVSDLNQLVASEILENAVLSPRR